MLEEVKEKFIMDILEVLKNLNTTHEIQEHVPVYTVDDIKKISWKLKGIGGKNLFLKDAREKFFLYILPQDKRADLKILANKINSKRLSFANEVELKTYLGLIPGSVTPLGVINDKESIVTLVLDKELKNKILLVHPNRNTATIAIRYEDLIKFINYCGNKYMEI